MGYTPARDAAVPRGRDRRLNRGNPLVSILRSALLALALVLGFGIHTASALKVVPFVAEFAPKGTGANQTFQVQNDTDQPAAVRMVQPWASICSGLE